jgi:hypothetical protein
VFHMDVAKVDQDVAMVVHVCCKLSPMFRMLQVFYLDVAYVFCNGFKCFLSVFCKCFIYLQTTLQVFDSECFKSRSDVTSVTCSSSSSAASP